MRAPRAVHAAGAAVVLAACGGPSPPPPLAEPAQFTLRGRWADPTALTWRCEGKNAPLGAESFARAVERAATTWSATGVVGLRPATDGQPADVTLGFRAGHHGACTPFGPTSDIAHAGPVASGTFIHFDLGRAWSEDGASGHSVFHAALHELGHVLGLGHSEAPAAVMGMAPLRPAVLSPHDLAGLHSLYGGGRPADGDLAIVAGGAVTATLCAVAPPGLADFGVFDSDGDGDDEVLVWRTDAAGHGALLVFHFARGPLVEHTVGPFPGAVAPGARVGFVRGARGERYLVCTFASGRPAVRAFDENGVPGLADAPPAPEVPARAAAPHRGDLDGDGRPEDVVARER